MKDCSTCVHAKGLFYNNVGSCEGMEYLGECWYEQSTRVEEEELEYEDTYNAELDGLLDDEDRLAFNNANNCNCPF